MISQIVYVSVATKDLEKQEIHQILETARSKNQIKNITGFLLFNGAMFLQMLEGDCRKVNDLFTTLNKDPRHNKIQKIYEGQAETNIFSNWSMAFSKINTKSEL